MTVLCQNGFVHAFIKWGTNLNFPTAQSHTMF